MNIFILEHQAGVDASVYPSSEFWLLWEDLLLELQKFAG
jgi:hypothetical protein